MTITIVRWLCSLCVLVLFGAAAAAESIGIVAVGDPPGPTPELAELTHQLRLVATERASGVVPANELRERMTGQTSSATLAELDRAYSGALATYQNGDFEGSVRTLRAVVQDLERLPASAEAFSQWQRAMLRLARAEQTLGHGGEAKDVLERLVRASPNIKVDPYQYPPSFAKQVAEASAAVQKLAKKKLTVEAAAKGAKVFVEGREVGYAPLAIELPPGRYRVSGAAGNVHVPTIVVDLTEEGQKVTLNFALAESLRPSFGPGLALVESERARNLVAAGNWLGVDKLLATRLVTESGVEYMSATMFDVRRGMLLREGRVRLANKTPPAGSLSALASFLITGATSKEVEAVPVPSQQVAVAPAPSQAAKKTEPAKPDLSAKPVAKKTDIDLRSPANEKARMMGWTAFGAGIASVALGGVAIFEGLQANSNYKKAADLTNNGILLRTATPEQYDSYVSKGNTAKTVGMVTGGAAVGLAVGAGVLGYLSYKQTGQVGPFRF
jgi:exonuclease VII small subunit